MTDLEREIINRLFDIQRQLSDRTSWRKTIREGVCWGIIHAVIFYLLFCTIVYLGAMLFVALTRQQ